MGFVRDTKINTRDKKKGKERRGEDATEREAADVRQSFISSQRRLGLYQRERSDLSEHLKGFEGEK